MDTTLILLLGVIAFLLCTMVYLWFANNSKLRRPKAPAQQTVVKKEKDNTSEITVDNSIYTDKIRHLAKRSENELIPEHRNLVKILIEKEYPELPAILQIGDLKLSIKRDHKNQSMFDTHNIIYALNVARCGYSRSTRYIPTKSEIEFILGHKDIINVYLKNLGLEQISDTDEFWYIDMPEGCRLNWPDYKWDLSRAYDKLHDKFFILTPDGIEKEPTNMKTKLLLLLDGYDELFEEV